MKKPARKSKIPGPLQPVAAFAMRGALSVPLLVKVDQATTVARSAARLFATSRVNRKKFPRALKNLSDAFPEWSPDRVRETAIRAYEHLFQLGIEILYAPRLITEEGFSRHLGLTGLREGARRIIQGGPTVLISGHVGNWELIGYAVSMLGFPMHAVYRPLDLKPLDDWIRYTRERQGLTLVSKFGAMRELPPVLQAGQPIGLVADQNGGDRGVFVPFFGRLTSTYKSIGLLAMKARANIICGFARRLRPDEPDPEVGLRSVGAGTRQRGGLGLGSPSMRYAAEVVDAFGPEDWEGQPDPLFYLTARYRRAIETMVRRAPEQYLWMHRIWRSRPRHEVEKRPFPAALRAKLESLPWMTAEELARIMDRSDRDAREGIDYTTTRT
jgi:KDO2-lipid IV(A) lauroyltransferase